MSLRGMRGAYDRSARAWAAGPELAYAMLAAELVAASPVSLAGTRVLDVGAGTGVAAHAAKDRGARVVIGVDVAEGMLHLGADAYTPVLADAAALPFRDDAFDVVVAACSVGHVPDPLTMLREAHRVGRVLLASAFPDAWAHPAKAAVEAALVPFGYHPPGWYATFKSVVEPQVADPAALAALARAAGYRTVNVDTRSIRTGLDTPHEQAAWRFGMAHVAPFVDTLTAGQRNAARRAAEGALVGAPALVVPLVVLTAS